MTWFGNHSVPSTSAIAVMFLVGGGRGISGAVEAVRIRAASNLMIKGPDNRSNSSGGVRRRNGASRYGIGRH